MRIIKSFSKNFHSVLKDVKNENCIRRRRRRWKIRRMGRKQINSKMNMIKNFAGISLERISPSKS